MRIELQRNGSQVGDNQDAVDVVKIDEDGHRDTVAIVATMTLAERVADVIRGVPVGVGDQVACILCGVLMSEDDANWIGADGDKPRPFCDMCERISDDCEGGAA